ncbi:hypothetical protein [Phaeodactylibacter xiamenensis]|jgi:uncharacterized membrane protein YhaH (DUF805 family)|uniref:hypothetical protein n=1 Tax=Phaeodactylibacter xiamenensis TaxID=1524460 RepID=UPI0024A7BB2D|nr:hypothetical protein [Phaeodactylibacter xiamenensis]
MVQASILLGSALFLFLTSLLYVQILGATNRTAMALKAATFAVGSAFLIEAFLPNLKLIFQLWESARMPEAPNLTLAKELAIQYGIIALFQIIIVLLSNFSAYLLPVTDEDWVVAAKDIFIAAFLIALAIIFSDGAVEFGKLAMLPEQIGFN